MTLGKVEVWFQDEARVGQQGTLTRVWARKGTRPRLVKQQQFINSYIFGAVCPEKDKGAALVLPTADTSSMKRHLQEISIHVQEGYSHHESNYGFLCLKFCPDSSLEKTSCSFGYSRFFKLDSEPNFYP